MSESATEVSIVSPVYQADETLAELVQRVESSMGVLDKQFELILVDDGSKDQSWRLIESLALDRPFLKGIKLSRNFGQHYAITAGLDNACGEWVVVMDCDLQDRPEEISRLWNTAQRGFDVVLARRINRNDLFWKKLFSKYFYRTLGYMTGSPQDETIGNFGIYHKKVIAEIGKMRESLRYFPTMVKWVGFNQTFIDVAHASRVSGKSGYSFKKLFNLGLDILLAYSDKPLRLAVKVGITVSLMGFLFALYTFIQYLRGNIIVAGYASLIISVWVLAGVVLATLGMVGLYVGKTFEGVKNRPIYIVEKRI